MTGDYIDPDDFIWEEVIPGPLHTSDLYRFGSPGAADKVAERASDTYLAEQQGRVRKSLDYLFAGDTPYQAVGNTVRVEHVVPFLLDPRKDLTLRQEAIALHAEHSGEKL